MAKYLLNLLFISLMLSSLALANNGDAKLQAKLQSEYGADLTHAPFFLRFAFKKEFNKDWKKTDYLERKAYLTDYEMNLMAQQKQEKNEARAEAIKEKERLNAQRDADLKEKERLNAEADEQRAENLEDEERQRSFNASVNDQQRELQEMQRESTEGTH